MYFPLIRPFHRSLGRSLKHHTSIFRQFTSTTPSCLALKRSVKVTNPAAISLLNLSKNVLKGILAFYLSALTIGLTGYGIASYYIDEKYSANWPWSSTIYSKLAIMNQDFLENNEIGQEFLIKCLKSLNPEDDDLPEGKFKLLTLQEFETKDKEWQATYINMVLRLAIVKFEEGKDLTNAKKLLLYAVNLPINSGELNLKSKGIRYIARLSKTEGDLKTAESYLLDDLRYNELYKDGIKFVSSGSNLLDLGSSYDPEVYEVLLELGKLYSVNEKTKSVEIFLNLLDNFENNESFLPIAESDGSIEPMLRVYVGELLYSKGLVHKSIEWNLHSFNDLVEHHHEKKSFMVLQQALTNLIALHTELDEKEIAAKFQKIKDQLKEPIDGGNLLKKLLF